MGAYALTVVVGIVGLTMALIASYQHFEQYTPYLPIFSAVVLTVIGVGVVAGAFCQSSGSGPRRARRGAGRLSE